MRTIFSQIMMAFLAFQATGAVRTIIPNGGAAVGNLERHQPGHYSAQIVSTSLLAVVGTMPSPYQSGPALFLGK